MDIDFSPTVLAIGLFGAVFLLVGCGGTGAPPNVPAGRFTAQIDGAVSDTISGAVYYRAREDSLVGLELGPEEEAGLSMELEPRPPALLTYEALDPALFGTDRPEGLPGVVAFLTLDGAHFESTHGTLELTYVDEEQVGAQFSFEMEGTLGTDLGEPASVTITGQFNAPARP